MARKNVTVGTRIRRRKGNSNVHGELYWLESLKRIRINAQSILVGK
jgi:hypothetical protein